MAHPPPLVACSTTPPQCRRNHGSPLRRDLSSVAFLLGQTRRRSTVAPGMRWRLAPTLFALSCALATSRVEAEEPSVPVSLEAELLAKVAAYDKHMAARAGDRVHVVILVKQGNPDSERASAQMAS